MQLTEAQIKKFQALYRQRFLIELNDEEAREKGLQLIHFMQSVYKPKPPTKHGLT
ncbi:MAG: hypothetical protein ACREGA_00785 [Candidatus Saccharimonadales bacterium]